MCTCTHWSFVFYYSLVTRDQRWIKMTNSFRLFLIDLELTLTECHLKNWYFISHIWMPWRIPRDKDNLKHSQTFSQLFLRTVFWWSSITNCMMIYIASEPLLNALVQSTFHCLYCSSLGTIYFHSIIFLYFSRTWSNYSIKSFISCSFASYSSLAQRFTESFPLFSLLYTPFLLYML